MSTIKTVIPLDETLYEQAERTARELRVSRSRLYAEAIREYLERRRNCRLFEKLNRVSSDGVDREERRVLRGIRRVRRRHEEAEPW
ncbi:MAG: hypothetical protein AB1714_17925 [Acidobacteriota bacterium]